MPRSTPHQKFCFYHLPTRGRATIKLGDAWYVSNVSINFDCSMLSYYLFWMFVGFILYIYIIFVTNLLIGGPTRIAVFLPISVFRRKGISNGVQTEWNLWERDFLIEYNSGDLDPMSRHVTGGHEVGGRASLPRGLLASFLTSTPSPLDHVCSKNHSPEGFIPFGFGLIFLFCETLK